MAPARHAEAYILIFRESLRKRERTQHDISQISFGANRYANAKEPNTTSAKYHSEDFMPIRARSDLSFTLDRLGLRCQRESLRARTARTLNELRVRVAGSWRP
jgi:hypothetical protein